MWSDEYVMFHVFVQVTGNSILAEEYWYTIFRAWLADLQKEVELLRSTDKANATWVDIETLSEKQVLAYSLTCSVGDVSDCSRVSTVVDMVTQ